MRTLIFMLPSSKPFSIVRQVCCLGIWLAAFSLGLAACQRAPEAPQMTAVFGPTPTVLSAENHLSRATQLVTLGQMSDALAEYDQALQLNPDSVEAYLGRGQTNKALGRQAEAIADFTAAIARAPEQVDAYLARAAVYEAQGEVSAAAADYQQVVALAPTNLEALYRLGTLAYDQDDLTTAQSSFESLTARSDEYPAAFAALGHIYLTQDKSAEALSQLTRAIDLGVTLPQAYLERAQLYTTGGDYDAAIADYKKVIDAGEAAAAVYYARGLVYLQNGQAVPALKDFRSAVEKDAGNPAYVLAVAQALNQSSEAQEARTTLDQLIQAQPDYAEAYVLRGTLEQASDAAAAEADFSQAILLNPQLVDAYYSRGSLYASGAVTGKTCEAALVDFTQVVTLAPDNIPGYIGQALCYEQLADSEQALAVYNAAVARDPNSVPALDARARYYQDAEAWSEALADYTAALALAPDDTALLIRRAQVYQALGQIDAALADLGRVADLRPQSTAPYIQRAGLYMDLAAAELALLADTTQSFTPEEIQTRRDLVTAYYTAASADYTQVLTLAPDNDRRFAWIYNRALAYQALEQWDAALSDYNVVLSEQPQSFTSAYLHRGEVLLALGRLDEALADLNRLVGQDTAKPIRDAAKDLVAAVDSGDYGQAETPTPAANVTPVAQLPTPTPDPATLAANAPRFPESVVQPWDSGTFIHTLESVRDSLRSFLNDWIPIILGQRSQNRGDCGTYLGIYTLWRVQAPVFEDVPADWVPLYVEYRSLLNDASYQSNAARVTCPWVEQDPGFRLSDAAPPDQFFAYAYPRTEAMLQEAYQMAP